jgi:hypothetical protein
MNIQQNTDRIFDNLCRQPAAPEGPARPDEGQGRRARVCDAVAQCVRKQAEAGIDISCDGEQSKPGFATYVRERLDGFEARLVEHPELIAERLMAICPAGRPRERRRRRRLRLLVPGDLHHRGPPDRSWRLCATAPNWRPGSYGNSRNQRSIIKHRGSGTETYTAKCVQRVRLQGHRQRPAHPDLRAHRDRKMEAASLVHLPPWVGADQSSPTRHRVSRTVSCARANSHHLVASRRGGGRGTA